jgi:predicted  nucleic acid-binding Zn-ribbon protein
VNAAPEAQLRLLDLQALDLALDRLATRRRALPELAEIERLHARRLEIADELALAEAEESDVSREQVKAEGDVDQVRRRSERDRERLDAGQVSSPRELENLQSEIVSLTRRQSELEDTVLEVMERREQLQARIAGLRDEDARLTTDLQTAERRRDEELQRIDGEVATTDTQRSGMAASLPEELLALYGKLRASAGGVGAAALLRGRCEGCHLQLTTADLNALRTAAPDAVARCEECRRILVRTPESGL